MFNSPSWVRKVPEGAAVKLSLPTARGVTPAMRWFDTTQPRETIAESSIATSMIPPLPVRSRRSSAAAIANAAVRPPMVSATG